LDRKSTLELEKYTKIPHQTFVRSIYWTCGDSGELACE